MRRWLGLAIVTVLVFQFIAVGCQNSGLNGAGDIENVKNEESAEEGSGLSQQPVENEGNEDDKGEVSDEASNAQADPGLNIPIITGLLPSQTGYKWQYFGFVEYAHTMTLDSIQHDQNRIIYNITGEVADMSDGESDKDFSLTITYIVEPTRLIQQKQEQVMMDSNFDEIELIRTPLAAGTSWTQQVTDKLGNQATLECQIEDVTVDTDGKKVYTILYDGQNSDYYEKRKIKEGIGVIFFEKLYIDAEQSFPISYSIAD
ncbi:hypothetical protein [Mahella australiensis]|uniref:Lipoprotein n=1 Tax=Mahella australiensis (strain DSM 15567 / CIP 107919 / 50-1 BON) TaxID=697281 RepID=F4A0N0_MAHA5|nr:hypothetical protein [Mahella australiensis]AEE95909.1 hypothetical protein Mahau_0708 [Mahella australiensis 50-1 BON]